MNNKTLRRIVCLILSLGMVFAFSIACFAQEEDNFSFIAMSDLHLDDVLFQTNTSNLDQFQQVLNASKLLDLDAFVGGGDYSSYGNSTYWNITKALVISAGYKQSVWAMGNHEFGTTGLRVLSRSRFIKFAGVKEAYYTKEINGYTFIVLAPETGLPNLYGYMSNAQKKWLSKTIKSVSAKANGKPIFVVYHFDLPQGSTRKDLTETLAGYDNVFVLWGHEHPYEYGDLAMDECVFASNGFVAAKMGSVHYYNNEAADGLIVRVYDDRVEFSYLRVSGEIKTPEVKTYYLK